MPKFIGSYLMFQKKIRKIVNSSFVIISAEMLAALDV